MAGELGSGVWSIFLFLSGIPILIFFERIWRPGAPPPKQQLPDHVWKGLLSDPSSFIFDVCLSFLNGLVCEGLRRKGRFCNEYQYSN